MHIQDENFFVQRSRRCLLHQARLFCRAAEVKHAGAKQMQCMPHPGFKVKGRRQNVLKLGCFGKVSCWQKTLFSTMGVFCCRAGKAILERFQFVLMNRKTEAGCSGLLWIRRCQFSLPRDRLQHWICSELTRTVPTKRDEMSLAATGFFVRRAWRMVSQF